MTVLKVRKRVVSGAFSPVLLSTPESTLLSLGKILVGVYTG
jgi:hypothetical protein